MRSKYNYMNRILLFAIAFHSDHYKYVSIIVGIGTIENRLNKPKTKF